MMADDKECTPHCWHRTLHVRPDKSARIVDQCCLCGLEDENTLFTPIGKPDRPSSHGPHAPKELLVYDT